MGDAIGGGRSTVELLAPARRGRVIADLGRASYYGTLTATGSRLVVVGGYDERLRAADAVWLVPIVE